MEIILQYTVLAWLANACFCYMLYFSLLPAQWLNNVLKLEDRLEEWNKSGNIFAVKILGGCTMCFSHFFTQILFWGYLFFMCCGVDEYWYNAFWLYRWGIYLIWYVVYVSVGTTVTQFVINKMLPRER